MIEAFGIPDSYKMDPNTVATEGLLEFYGHISCLRFIGIDGKVMVIGPVASYS